MSASSGAQHRTSHTSTAWPSSASRSAALLAASTILPTASTHALPSPSTHAPGVQAGADLVLAHLAGRATRVADGDRAVVGEVHRVEQHLLQLLRARRCEHAHAGHLGQQAHVVHAVVRCAVGPGDAGAVEREDHGQAVQRDVVDDLVPGPVEERRVDRHHRAQARHRHARRGGDGVLLGDADVEEAIGEVLLERQQPGRAGHRRRDGDDPRVELGGLDDGLGERLGVAGGHGLGRAHLRVEHRCVVEVLLVVVLGGRVAAPLLREHVHHDRTLGRQLLGVAERLLEVGDVVAVDRADVPHAERLEERGRLQELADPGLERLHGALGVRADARQVLQVAPRDGAGGARTPG